MPDSALSSTFSLAADRLDLGALYPEPDTGAVHYSGLFAARLSGASLNGQSPESVAEGLYGGVELPAYAVEGRMDLQVTMELPVSALQQSNRVARRGGDGGPLRTLVERRAGGPSADATAPVIVRLGGTMRAPPPRCSTRTPSGAESGRWRKRRAWTRSVTSSPAEGETQRHRKVRSTDERMECAREPSTGGWPPRARARTAQPTRSQPASRRGRPESGARPAGAGCVRCGRRCREGECGAKR